MTKCVLTENECSEPDEDGDITIRLWVEPTDEAEAAAKQAAEAVDSGPTYTHEWIVAYTQALGATWEEGNLTEMADLHTQEDLADYVAKHYPGYEVRDIAPYDTYIAGGKNECGDPCNAEWYGYGLTVRIAPVDAGQ